MAASETAIAIVELNGGLAVPLAALQLLWDLEARGFTLETHDGRLFVLPREQVTPADEGAIRRYRDHLVALVRHCEGQQ